MRNAAKTLTGAGIGVGAACKLKSAPLTMIGTTGVATIGCCCNMVGFAVAGYRENKMGGLIAQGVGTSMLQVSNIVKKPHSCCVGIYAKKGINCTRRHGFRCLIRLVFGKMLQKC